MGEGDVGGGKEGVVLGSSLSRLQGKKGGHAPDSVSGLRHSRIILLLGAEDSMWGEAGNPWDRRRGLGNKHLVHGMKQWVDLIVFFILSLAERPWL